MKTIISIKELTKTYIMGAAKVHALRGVTLDIFKNEYVALMGPSGSGKSTLMNLIGCLDTPSSGEYWLNGTNVSTMDDNDLADVRNKEIGFVFQTFNLLPRLTALDNVALPLVYAGLNKAARLDKARQVLDAVGLGDRMDHKPNELSGGQRQRVAVALPERPIQPPVDAGGGSREPFPSAHQLPSLGQFHLNQSCYCQSDSSSVRLQFVVQRLFVRPDTLENPPVERRQGSPLIEKFSQLREVHGDFLASSEIGVTVLHVPVAGEIVAEHLVAPPVTDVGARYPTGARRRPDYGSLPGYEVEQIPTRRSGQLTAPPTP